MKPIMLIRVDARAALPVYEQIRQQIERMVVAGTLAKGSRLPTIRQLSTDLGIAKGTVAKAYGLLEAATIIESRGHKGTFVLSASKPSADAGVEAQVAADAFVVTARQAGLTLEQASECVEAAWHRF